MKKLLFFLTIVLIAAIVGCEKDELAPLQPRTIKVTIMPRTAKKMVWAETGIQHDRATNNPSAYDSLAWYYTEQVWLVIQDEMPTTITKVVGEYDNYWRNESPKYQSKVWNRINVGVDVEMYRVAPEYSEAVLRYLQDYCHIRVNGDYDWNSGERIPEKEEEIKNLFRHDPDPMVEWQYKDRLYDYFKRYARDPNEKAKYQRDGFLNMGSWTE